MSITRLNPDGLARPVGYCHVTVAEGTRIVSVSGQVGIGPDGEVVGKDLGSQAEQAMRNLVTALDAGGASVNDVAKMTIYIADYTPEAMGPLFEASLAVFGHTPIDTATTLIGVAALADPQYKIEIEATAVLS